MAEYTIRIPDVMHERIKTAAAEDIRSRNGEVEYLLGDALDRRDRGPAADEVAVPVSILTALIGAPATENAQMLAMDKVQELLTAHYQESRR